MAALGWLSNKVWRGYRHEIANMKQATANVAAAMEKKAPQTEVDAAWKEIGERRRVEAKLFDMVREHERSDDARFERNEAANRDRHDELMAVIGDLRADIAGLKR